MRHFGGLIRALGARYDGHTDLELVDVSIVGAWGEGAGAERLTDVTRRALLDCYLETFQQTPLVLQLQDAHYALAKRPVGWRVDCLGDMGGFSKTWSHMNDYYPQTLIQTGMQDAWRRAPVTMEVCWVMQHWKNQGWDIDHIIDESLKWHISSFNAKSSAVPPEWWPQVNRWLKKMGYRFVLRKFTYPRAVNPGGDLAFTSWWDNKGVAPCYKKFPLALRLEERPAGGDSPYPGGHHDVAPGRQRVRRHRGHPGEFARGRLRSGTGAPRPARQDSQGQTGHRRRRKGWLVSAWDHQSRRQPTDKGPMITSCNRATRWPHATRLPLLPVNLVAADVRKLILFPAREVNASLHRLLLFMGSKCEIFWAILPMNIPIGRASLICALILLATPSVSVVLSAESARSSASKRDTFAAHNGAAMERLPLFDGRIEKVWATAESDLAGETNRTAASAPALRWHINVDHYGGEPRYLIGWPRVSRAFKGDERDWSGFDYLEFRVRAETTRERLPGQPVTLQVRMDVAEGAWSRPLTELKKGEWVKFAFPLDELPKPEAVSQIMFSISDSNYRHQDEVEFTIADLALTRFTAPTLLEFVPEQAVLFTDASGWPVRFRVSGVKAGERAEVVCELKRDGKTISRETIAAARGPQRVMMRLGEKPPPGAGELVGRIGNGPPQVCPVRFVESPWTERRDRR